MLEIQHNCHHKGALKSLYLRKVRHVLTKHSWSNDKDSVTFCFNSMKIAPQGHDWSEILVDLLVMIVQCICLFF